MKFIKYLGLTLLFSFALEAQNLSPTPSRESSQSSWAINEKIQDILVSFSAAEIVKALKSYNIEAKLVQPQDYLMKYKILEGIYFTVYLAPRAFEEKQVWILANKNTPARFEELTADQLKELESLRYLVGEVFLKHLNYDGYVSFINAEKNYGLNRQTFCLEMLPARYQGKNHDQVDILVKLERVWYVLYEAGKETFLTPEQAKGSIEKIKGALKTMEEKGLSLASQKRVSKSTLPWSRKLIHLEKLKAYCLEEFQRELVNAHDFFLDNPQVDQRSSKETLKGPGHNEGEFTQTNEDALEITKCAFCNPKVIESQQVITYGDFVGLYNFRPYILDYHFMITPNEKTHIENWQYLSLDDAVKADQLAQAFVKAIKKESDRNDIVLFIQNGFAGGMTVPHGHLHVLLKPPALRLIAMNLIEMTGPDVEGIHLSAEQMKPTREKFKALVQKYISEIQ